MMGGFGGLVTAVASALALAACGGTAPGKVTSASTIHLSQSVQLAKPPALSTRPAPSPTHKPSPTAAATHRAPGAAPVLLEAGNPNGTAYVPPAAQPVNTSHPTHVIGDGTPASCTSAAVVADVAAGGIITFNCGPQPVTIAMQATAAVSNTSQEVVLDGGGKVTLSGGGVRQILFMDTCGGHVASGNCWSQSWPQLTVQNLAFADGNATSSDNADGGGGAIWVLGGQLKVINSTFLDNRCYATGPDLGGAAIRARAGVSVGCPRQPADLYRAQHVPRRRLLQWRRAQQHRRVLGGTQQPHDRKSGHRRGRQPGQPGHPGRRQRREPSTPTVTSTT